MPPKRGAKAAEAPPPKRGGAKAEAKAKADAAPKRGAKAAAAEPPPKRGAAKAAAAPAADEEPEPEVTNYEAWPTTKLQSKLKELGLSTTGSKRALVERLQVCGAMAEAKAAAKADPKAEPAAAKAEPKTEPEPKAKAKAKGRGAPDADSGPPPPKGKARPAAQPESAPPKKAAKAAPQATASSQQSQADEPASSQPSSSQPAAGITYEDGEFKADYAKSNRSTCKKCKEAIEMGAMRLGKMVASDKFDGKVPQWYHYTCFLAQSTLPRSTSLISGFSTLRPEDQEKIMQKIPPAAAEGGDPAQDSAMKEQNEKVFEVHDVLKTMSQYAIKELLEANGYPTQKTGVTTSLLELCADGIVFGRTGRCEVCGNEKKRLLLSGEGYRCTGWVNEYLKCSFKTQTPPREPWEMTDACKNACGGKLKRMKFKTGDRLFASKLGDVDAESGTVAPSQAQSGPQAPLTDIQIAVVVGGDNMTQQQLEEFVQKHGGTFEQTITKATSCVVTTDVTANLSPEPSEISTAKELGVPGVTDEYLSACVKEGAQQDMTPYLLWGEARKVKRAIEETTMRFIEKNGVAMDSDVGELASKAHVLVDKAKKIVYSERMNRTDLVSGGNAFYTLHLLEADDASSPQYWLFRKWGRIGVSQGGCKTEDFGGDKFRAIMNFKKQYFDKTGNEFGHAADAFVVKNGKFIRLDMEHKALGPPGKKAKTEGKAEASGDGGGDQPLGKLSKVQIEKGDAVLDKIEGVLNEGIDASTPVGSARYLALSAEFYSLIPHNFGFGKPPTINNPDMVGAERALLQFYLRMGFEDMDDSDKSLTPISGVMDLPLPKTLEEAAKSVCGAKDIKACHTKAVGLAKKKAGKPKGPMGAELYGSILLYTANAIYKDLNKCLRDEDRAKVERYFSYLRLLFEACARLPQSEKTLWRGIGVDLSDSYKVGSTIIWWGVSSCTSEKKVAQDFMKGCGDKATFLTVETKTACDISELSFYSNEAESILLPGTQLEVLKSEKMGKNSAITLKEVGRVVG